MANVFKKKPADDELPDPVAAVAVRLKEELAPVEKKREQGQAALVRRKFAEWERVQGLGSLGVDERLMRSGYSQELLRSGTHITIDAKMEEMEIRKRGAAGYREAQKQIAEELGEIEAEYQALAVRRLRLQRLKDEAFHKALREDRMIAELGRELEGYLTLAEDIGRGADIKLWTPPDPQHPIWPQPSYEVSPSDLVAFDQNMPLNEARKLAHEANQKLRQVRDREHDDLFWKRELNIKQEELKYLPASAGSHAA